MRVERMWMQVVVCGLLLASWGLVAASQDAPDFTSGEEIADSVLYREMNLGPTGARGVMYRHLRYANQIRVTSIDEGSPADGVLQVDDVILGIGSEPFGDNARQRFGEAITQAETKEAGGSLHLLRWRDGETETVTLQLAVMGSYSDTAPWNCEKSNRIVEGATVFLKQRGTPLGDELGTQALIASLGLLATGDERYLPLVQAHVESIVERTLEAPADDPPHGQFRAWSFSYINILLNEYYGVTGDRQVLPAIERYALATALGQSSGGTWSHGMRTPDPETGEPLPIGPYGTVNQVSIACWLSLVLAQRNGVRAPLVERAIHNKSTFLRAFVDFGSIPYGDSNPSVFVHDNNGRNSLAAVGFAALGDEAATDFFSRMTVASHAVREHGHTGHYWSDLWGATSAARSGSKAAAAFLREDLWRLDLERRWDGSFVFQSGGSYVNWDMTGPRLIHFSLPRQQLVITGRDVISLDLPSEVVAEAIEAGRQPRHIHSWRHKYEDLPVAELLPLLGHWSAVAREQAAHALAMHEDVPVETLREMLGSESRYARYGAASALWNLGSRAQPAVENLIALLESEDRVLQIHAIRALGRTDDARAVDALFDLAGRAIADDPYEVVRRRVGEALFGRGNLAGRARGYENRERVLAATREFLTSFSGPARNGAASNLLPTLSLEEFASVWPDIEYARNTIATAAVTNLEMVLLRRLQEFRVREGIDKGVAYLTEMPGWRSQLRVPEVLNILRGYGAHMRVSIPDLERIAHYFEHDHDFRRSMALRKARYVEEFIAELEAMEDPDEDDDPLISIADGWK